MKITSEKIKDKDFKPVKLTIDIHTKKEYDLILDICCLDLEILDIFKSKNMLEEYTSVMIDKMFTNIKTKLSKTQTEFQYDPSALE